MSDLGADLIIRRQNGSLVAVQYKTLNPVVSGASAAIAPLGGRSLQVAFYRDLVHVADDLWQGIRAVENEIEDDPAQARLFDPKEYATDK